jgi:hypothetical protein
MSECAVCGDVGPFPIFVETNRGHELEHRCIDHLPTDEDET